MKGDRGRQAPGGPALHDDASDPRPLPFPLAGGDTLADRLSAMTHDLLGAAGADRRLTWTNPAWQPLLGWSPEELAARCYHELIHPDDLERVKAFELDVLAGRAGDRPEAELRLRATDGTYRWFVFSTSYSMADELVFFCGKDITARKQGEEELRAAEERFRAVTGSTRDGIVSADLNGRIIFWNARRRVDLRPRRPRRCSAGRSTDLMPERYRDAHRAGMARFLATGEGRVMGSTVEVEGLRADGTEFPLELSLGSWVQRGQMCFTAVIRDLSDRVRARRALREAEERFAGAFEGAAVGLMLAAPDGTLLRANRALCELSGWPEDELVGRRFDELLHPEDRGLDARRARGDARRPHAAARHRAPLPHQRRRLARRPHQPLADPRHRRRPAALRRPDRGRHRAPPHDRGADAVRGSLQGADRAACRTRRSTCSTTTCGCWSPRASGCVRTATTRPRSRAGCWPTSSPRAAYERLEPEYRAALAGELRSFDYLTSDGTATYWVQIAPLRDDLGHVIGGMALSRDITGRRPPSASSRTVRASSSAPTPSSSSSPTSPRTTSPSRCGWSRATCSCCAGATPGSSTPTPTSSSTSPSTARRACAT